MYIIHTPDEIGNLNRYDLPSSEIISEAERVAGEIAPYDMMDPIPEAVGGLKGSWEDEDERRNLAANIMNAISNIASRFNNAYIDVYTCPSEELDGEECLSSIIQSAHQALVWETAPYPNMMKKFDRFLIELGQAIDESTNEMQAMQHAEAHRANGQEECYGCNEYSDESYGYGGYDYGTTDYGNGNGTGAPVGEADARIEELCKNFIANVIDYENGTATALSELARCCNAILNGMVKGKVDQYAEWRTAGWDI